MSAKFTYVFSKTAYKDLQKLDTVTKKRIARKLEYFIAQPDPLIHARPLVDSSLGSYRFRVGHYRVVFDVEDSKLIVHNIKHRGDVYRKK